jgi:SAM-dependent methyltransferase
LLERSLHDQTFAKAVLGKYRGPEESLSKVILRPVRIKDQPLIAVLHRYRDRDVVRNLSGSEAIQVVREALGRTFMSGHLFSLERDAQIEFSRKGKPRLTLSRPTVAALPDGAHDREKHRALDRRRPYLQALEITDEHGRVRPGSNDKWRQVNRFIEIFSDAFEASDAAKRDRVKVIDVGCGKGYLTFAVHDFLSGRPGVAADVTGLDRRENLVRAGQRIAERLGLAGLRFALGDVETLAAESVDVLIALHACDTATDAAIETGIKGGASVILCAPCCHREIRPQLSPPPVLQPIFRFGILKEREAETVTDALRALWLEYAGYRVSVQEFVSAEHTQKNTMIMGIRGRPGSDPAAVLAQIDGIKSLYGIQTHRLDTLRAP